MRAPSTPLAILLAALLWSTARTQTTPATAPLAPATAVRLGVFFWHDSPNDQITFAGIENGFQAAGRAVLFVERRANGDRARAQLALTELRAAGCRLLFAMGTQAALLAQEHVPEIPLVFTAVANPVASGITAAWTGSGTSVAGASYWIGPATLVPVFRLAVPGLQRLGMLRSETSGVVSRAELEAMRAWIRTTPGTALQVVEAIAQNDDDVERAVAALLQQGVQAIWIPNDFTIYQNLHLVTKQATAARVPLVATALAAARNDAILGATVDFELHGRRTAALALRILDGEEPGALPVDTMHGFRILVNVDAARRAGIEVPLSLLVLADELIAEETTDDRPR